MNSNPQIFHGEWWVPAVADHDTRMLFQNPKQMMGHEKRYTGTLTFYGDKNTILELYHVPSDYHSSHYVNNNVIWGKDANGHVFTLFNVVVKEKRGFDMASIVFVVGVVLIGEHVLSGDDKLFKRSEVDFSYLDNWIFYETRKYIHCSLVENEYQLQTTIGSKTLIDVPVEKELKWKIDNFINVEQDIHYISINKKPRFITEASTPVSVKEMLKQIGEFEQFLSIALYCNQSFERIRLLSNRNNQCELLIKKDVSFDPIFLSLIKFDLFIEKLPSMLIKWHENFERIAPISSYLIDSLQRKSRFDVPDFLIIAQALDGYHKRFVNKKDGRDVRKYEEQIDILLNQFKDVKAIQKCRINSVVLKDTRHKYSHLYPDDEESLAVDSNDLYWLTEKCKILLTCCILNMLGLTNKEINLCCETQSPIKQIIDSFPLEID